MADLGDFGVARPAAELDTFGWYGAKIRLAPAAGAATLLVMDVFEEVGDRTDLSEVESVGLLKGVIRQCIHPEDFKEFWDLALANGQGLIELMGLIKELGAASAEVPTRLPAGSTGGHSTTPGTSAVSASSPIADLVAEGRPDLALVHLDAAEARERGPKPRPARSRRTG